MPQLALWADHVSLGPALSSHTLHLCFAQVYIYTPARGNLTVAQTPALFTANGYGEFVQAWCAVESLLNASATSMNFGVLANVQF